ncbi:MAG: hypothetical protein P8010_20400 [Desulfosarcinaceae bacterium]
MNAPPNTVPRHAEGKINQRQVDLARLAADGDAAARRAVTEVVHPIITYQTRRFCRRFCRGNRHRFRCTLEPAPLSSTPSTSTRSFPTLPSRAPADALLCEFGNASYAWMLDDLTRPERLRRFEGRQGARLYDYLFRIANSLPFYERWKDWRFGQSAYVPTYIRDLAPLAGRVFLELRAGDGIPAIAQKLQLDEIRTESLGRRIIALLTRKNRLFLLVPPTTVSLCETEAGGDGDRRAVGVEKELPSFDETPELREAKQRLQAAWGRLTAVEQFVLEAMLIDGESADTVLRALAKVDIALKIGVAPQDTNRQQLYYFRRKAFEKLRRLMFQKNGD